MHHPEFGGACGGTGGWGRCKYFFIIHFFTTLLFSYRDCKIDKTLVFFSFLSLLGSGMLCNMAGGGLIKTFRGVGMGRIEDADGMFTMA